MKIRDIASYDLEAFDDQKLRESLLSEYTVRATPEESALEVARRAEKTPGIIVMVDEDDEPRAVVDPEALQRRLKQMKGIHAKNLGQALKRWATEPAERARGFRHEWLNAAYDPHWCATGRHYTTFAPCPVHEV